MSSGFNVPRFWFIIDGTGPDITDAGLPGTRFLKTPGKAAWFLGADKCGRTKNLATGYGMTRKNNNSGDPVQAVVDFFTSIKLTIVLLALIALISFFGTTSREFVFSLSDRTALFFNFTDVYHTNAYRILLGLLFTNLLVCTIDGLPRAIRRFKQDGSAKAPPPPRDADYAARIKADSLEQALEKAGRAFLGEGDHPRRELELSDKKRGAPGKMVKHIVSFRSTGRISVLGPLVTHIGILAIIIGGMLASLRTFEASLWLSPGEQTKTARVDDKVLKPGANTGLIYIQDKETAREIGPEKYMYSPSEKTLDFAIRCNDFDITFYDNSRMASDYIADLSIVVGGEEVKRGKIEVNQPLNYKGYGIYQSSYEPEVKIRLVAEYLGEPEDSPLPGPDDGSTAAADPLPGDTAAPDPDMAEGDASSPGEQPGNTAEAASDSAGPADGDTAAGATPARQAEMEPGDTVSALLGQMEEWTVPGDTATFIVGEYEASMRGMGMDMGPTLTVGRRAGGEVYGFRLFENFPDFDRERGDRYALTFKAEAAGYRTGLQLIKDPGLPFVWVGFLLLVGGAVQSLMIRHRRYWVVARPDGKGRFEVRFIGRSKKGRDIFAQKLEAMAREAGEKLGTEFKAANAREEGRANK